MRSQIQLIVLTSESNKGIFKRTEKMNIKINNSIQYSYIDHIPFENLCSRKECMERKKKNKIRIFLKFLNVRYNPLMVKCIKS